MDSVKTGLLHRDMAEDEAGVRLLKDEHSSSSSIGGNMGTLQTKESHGPSTQGNRNRVKLNLKVKLSCFE